TTQTDPVTNASTAAVEAHTAADDASRTVTAWLEAFDEALRAHDADAVADLFEVDGFWRDFVAFTWNLRTLEGRDQIRDMVAATVAHAAPSAWALAEPATEADGVHEAWITFETGAARGWGHLRVRDG